MAVGSLLIVGLFFLSRLAPLQTVNWLIRNMLVYVGIRRDRASSSPTSAARWRTSARRRSSATSNRQEAADETIEEIVVAATMLAAQQVGAIIAIEREIGLRNYIESGIPLDADADLRPAGHASSSRPRRCTTAPSSCRTTGSRRQPASCR